MAGFLLFAVLVKTVFVPQLATLIQGDELDILIDLAGHAGNLQIAVMGFKPAPVQVNYLGYAGTLGQDYCDYIIADRFVIPEESRQYYAENVVYLPDCCMVNDSGRTISGWNPSRAEAGSTMLIAHPGRGCAIQQ